MAEHIHKSYACDRCKKPIDAPGSPKSKYPRLQLSGSVHGEWAGYDFKWIDLCDDCWTAIHEFLGRPTA